MLGFPVQWALKWHITHPKPIRKWKVWVSYRNWAKSDTFLLTPSYSSDHSVPFSTFETKFSQITISLTFLLCCLFKQVHCCISWQFSFYSFLVDCVSWTLSLTWIFFFPWFTSRMNWWAMNSFSLDCLRFFANFQKKLVRK